MNYQERVFNLLVEALELDEGSMSVKRLRRKYNSKELSVSQGFGKDFDSKRYSRVKAISQKAFYKNKQGGKRTTARINKAINPFKGKVPEGK